MVSALILTFFVVAGEIVLTAIEIPLAAFQIAGYPGLGYECPNLHVRKPGIGFSVTFYRRHSSRPSVFPKLRIYRLSFDKHDKTAGLLCEADILCLEY